MGFGRFDMPKADQLLRKDNFGNDRTGDSAASFGIALPGLGENTPAGVTGAEVHTDSSDCHRQKSITPVPKPGSQAE